MWKEDGGIEDQKVATFIKNGRETFKNTYWL